VTQLSNNARIAAFTDLYLEAMIDSIDGYTVEDYGRAANDIIDAADAFDPTLSADEVRELSSKTSFDLGDDATSRDLAIAAIGDAVYRKFQAEYGLATGADGFSFTPRL